MPLDADIPVKEIERYMGYRGDAGAEQDVFETIVKAVEQVKTQSHPRIISREYPITVSGNDIIIHADTEDTTLSSESLRRNLEGCCGAILLAATIGPACDMLVRRAEVRSMAEASVYQATGAAAIESFLDNENDKLRKQYEAEGFFLRPRFSPGYGDLSLDCQKDWFRLLDITKNIGIELTDSLLMVPTKSVTAIIGIGYDKDKITETGCAACNNRASCLFSKERARK